MKKLTVLMSCIAVSLLVLLFCGVTVKADNDHPHEDSTKHCYCGENSPGVAGQTLHTCSASNKATQWQPASTAADLETMFSQTSNQFYYLTCDITLNTPLAAKKGYQYSLCLNGYTLTAPAGERAFVLDSVNSSTYIRICDCSSGMKGRIQPNASTGTLSKAGGLVYIGSGGRLWFFGGTITGGRTSSESGGGNIYLKSGTMYMYGGTIADGKTVTSTASKARGGNISIYHTSSAILRFVMYGGTITNADTLEGSETGNAYQGGNIYVNAPANNTYECYLEMHGGTITGGTAANAGGNLYMIGSGIAFTMDGGTISNGSINGTGGGGNVYSGIPFRMTGGTISGGRVLKSLSGGNGANVTLVAASSDNYLGGSAVLGKVDANSRSGGYNLAIASECVIEGNFQIGETGKANTIQLNAGTANVTVNSGLVLGMIAGVGGTLTVNGGIVTGKLRSTVYNSTACAITVNGGFAGSAEIANASASMTLNGGYFGEIKTTNPITIGAGKKQVSFSHSEPYLSTALQTAFAVIPEKAPVGKRMALNENLSILFEGVIDKSLPYLKNGTKISLSLDGAEAVTVPEVSLGTVSRYTFSGITPECMGDTIEADFVAVGDDGADYVLYSTTFTLKDYLNQIPASAEYAAFSAGKRAALDTLISDLIVYGGEAQRKFNHNTANLVSTGVTGSNRAPAGADTVLTFDGEPVPTAATVSDASVIPGFFKEATVIHENVNWIRVLFRDNSGDGNTTFTFEKEGGMEETITLNNGYVCTDGLMPTEYGKTLTFKAYRLGSLLCSLAYSVNTYCKNKAGNPFSDALYNYGVSAAEYAAFNETPVPAMTALSPNGTVDTVDPDVRTYLARAHAEYTFGDTTFTVQEYGDLSNKAVPVTFSFRNDSGSELIDPVLEISESADFSAYRSVSVGSEMKSGNTYTVPVYNLKTGTAYYWRVSVLVYGDQRVPGTVNTFATEAGPRILLVDGVSNARDVGGWATLNGGMIRQGLLYRSQKPDGATAAGIDTLLNELGIVTEIDLRNPELAADLPMASPFEHSATVNYINHTTKSYSFFIQPDVDAEIMRIFADPANYPILFHCNAGADRTGAWAFMVKALCGGEGIDLVCDYELTNNRFQTGTDTYPFSKLVNGLLEQTGNTLQEKAYNFLKDGCGMTDMELQNIITMMTSDSAVFTNPSATALEVQSGQITAAITLRSSENVTGVTDENGVALPFTFANGVLTVTVSGTAKTAGTVTFNDGSTLPLNWTVE